MNSVTFSPNLFADFAAMWQYDFMRHAFEAGTIVAIVAGVIGYFVILRRSSFAAHALSHVGFTGAAGAVLLGISPIFGLFLFTMSGALMISALGKRAASRDMQIGVVLAFMLGLGVLFISLYTGYATEAYSLLFGEILGISQSDVWVTLIAGLVVLAVFAVVYRPLLFTSLDEEVAEAKGLPVLGVGLIFMLLVAAATSIAVEVVGVLLIFALMVTPAAIAQRLTSTPARGILLSVGIALIATWLGLFISFYLPYPVSFFITSLTFVAYLTVRWIRPVFR
jgi:zinc/manganese transport system permease protein